MDGWLFYDHHHRDPLAYRILGLDASAHVTRRWFYFVPAVGEPRKLVHRIEAMRLDSLPGVRAEYSSWQELEAQLQAMLTGADTIAMQYSMRNAIPAVGLVDAGAVELVRDLGKQVVSSADLVSQFEAVLTEAQIATHFAAQQKIDQILEAAWSEIGTRIRRTGTDEFSIVQWISEAMRREGLVWEHGPNVSCGPNSADSHYEPTVASSKPIRTGDFVLIDIWGKVNRPDACYYDITWTGFVGEAPDRIRTTFETVTGARDAAIAAVKSAVSAGRAIRGFEVDDAARGYIHSAGQVEHFVHRTGHSIGEEVHGTGANMDNLETHDDRRILPGALFSIEPGLYYSDYGIRSEINMFVSATEAVVTGEVQTELLRIG